MGPWQDDLCPHIYKCLTHKAKYALPGRQANFLLVAATGFTLCTKIVEESPWCGVEALPVYVQGPLWGPRPVLIRVHMVRPSRTRFHGTKIPEQALGTNLTVARLSAGPAHILRGLEILGGAPEQV